MRPPHLMTWFSDRLMPAARLQLFKPTLPENSAPTAATPLQFARNASTPPAFRLGCVRTANENRMCSTVSASGNGKECVSVLC